MDCPIESFPTGIGQGQVCLMLPRRKGHSYVHASLKHITRRDAVTLTYGSTLGETPREDIVRVMADPTTATLIVNGLALVFATHARLRKSLAWLRTHGITVDYHDQEAEAAFA